MLRSPFSTFELFSIKSRCIHFSWSPLSSGRFPSFQHVISTDTLYYHAKRKYQRKQYQKVDRHLRSNSASDTLTALVVCQIDDPTHDVWEQPRIEEMNAQIANKTWVLEHAPAGANIIKCDFVYAYKLDPITKQLRPKARLVAKGYAQKLGIDFLDTYAPTMSLIGVKTLMAIILQLGLHCLQFDVKTAFLNSKLTETIYMSQPSYFNDWSGRVCRLLKSIYGLKQAARDWYLEFRAALNEFGFTVVDSEQCMFIRVTSAVYTVLGLYVDDGVAASNSLTELENLFKFLNTKYTMKTGPLNKFIGLEIEQFSEKIRLHQQT